MRPQDNNQPSHPSTPTPQRDPQKPSRDAAVNVVRSQLDQLYNNQAAEPQTTAPVVAQPQAEQWKQYHSAWQDYYQKYYERYYAGHLQRALQENSSSQPIQPATPPTKDEALFTLREQLRSKVTESAQKVRKSRHFIPIAAALCVVLLFTFLQYNSLLIGTVQAYVSPGAIDPQNIVVDPSTQIAVSADPRLIIPKINVDVPMVYGAGSDHDSMMAAMQNGIAHFAIPGASSVPGQKGNTVFSGHSSNDLFEAGNYKFIFSQLNKLDTGDTIYVNYQSKRYTYTVSGKKIVAPTDVSALYGTNDKPILTLITCWPIGTANQRVILTADQISPDPSTAAAAPVDGSTTSGAMPGNGNTVLDKLFGNNGG